MKIYFHWKSDLFTKILYYKNLEPYSIEAFKRRVGLGYRQTALGY